MTDETPIKPDIVSDEDYHLITCAKLCRDRRKHGIFVWRITHHVFRDAGHQLNEVWDRLPRIHQRLVPTHDIVVLDHAHRDFGHAMIMSLAAGGFDVNNDKPNLIEWGREHAAK